MHRRDPWVWLAVLLVAGLGAPNASAQERTEPPASETVASGAPPSGRMRGAREPRTNPRAGGTEEADADESALVALGTARLIRAAGFSPEKVLDHYGLDVQSSCRTYRKWSYLVVRREAWREAIQTLARTHPEYLYGWITGVRRPPRRVRRIVLQQRNCLLDDLHRRAAEPGTELEIEVELDDELVRTDSRLDRLAEAYLEGSPVRHRMRAGLTESHYRAAKTQAQIWRRKVAFRGTNFNRISERAARKCSLPAGAAWKPDVDRHERCWERVLGPREREREILSASAAPGLSRHHWGTEVDLFGLAPHRFQQGRRRWDEYRWMTQHALAYGFFQSYGEGSDTYVEERWHWSYYPIAQALTEFASEHPSQVYDRLDTLWNRIERRHNRDHPETPVTFQYVRDHWERYMFDITVPPVGGAPPSRTHVGEK